MYLPLPKINLVSFRPIQLHWATKRYFCQIVRASLGYIGVTKSENTLSFAAKLQKYLSFVTVNECDH